MNVAWKRLGPVAQVDSHNPFRIAAGPDGNLWFTEKEGNRVGRITPAGEVTEFSVTVGSNPWGIAAGPDGNLWFTEYGGNRIGRIGAGASAPSVSAPVWWTAAVTRCATGGW